MRRNESKVRVGSSEFLECGMEWSEVDPLKLDLNLAAAMAMATSSYRGGIGNASNCSYFYNVPNAVFKHRKPTQTHTHTRVDSHTHAQSPSHTLTGTSHRQRHRHTQRQKQRQMQQQTHTHTLISIYCSLYAPAARIEWLILVYLMQLKAQLVITFSTS